MIEFMGGFLNGALFMFIAMPYFFGGKAAIDEVLYWRTRRMMAEKLVEIDREAEAKRAHD